MTRPTAKTTEQVIDEAGAAFITASKRIHWSVLDSVELELFRAGIRAAFDVFNANLDARAAPATSSLSDEALRLAVLPAAVATVRMLPPDLSVRETGNLLVEWVRTGKIL